jgi:hypothetical protein
VDTDVSILSFFFLDGLIQLFEVLSFEGHALLWGLSFGCLQMHPQLETNRLLVDFTC